MAKKFDIAVLGDKQLAKQFDALEKKTQGKILRPAMRKGMKIVLAAAKAAVPVKTGKLKKSLKIKALTKKNLGSKVSGVGLAIFTGTAEELGIKQRTGKKGGYYPLSVEVGYRKKNGLIVPGRPFLRPAMKNNEPQVFQIMRTEMNAGIKKLARAAK